MVEFSHYALMLNKKLFHSHAKFDVKKIDFNDLKYNLCTSKLFWFSVYKGFFKP